MAVKKKSKGRYVTVDFSNVKESGGGGLRVKEGDYAAHIVKIDLTESQKSGNTMLVFYYQLWKDGKLYQKGKTIRDNIVLTENVLWRLRNLLLAMGKKAPKSIAKLNIDGLTGDGDEPQLALEIGDGDEYQGRVKSEVRGYLTLEEFEEEDEDEDSDDEESEDEDDEDEDEELDEIDVDEI